MTDLRQLHFRFRTDAGTADASPTWGASEDVSYYPGTANFRLRIGLRNASTVVAATPWELYVSRNGDAYTPVTTTIAKGVQSVDAGSSADDTQVLIPRLYPFSSDWMLSGAAIDLDLAGGRIYPGGAFTDFLSITRASTGYATTASGTLTSFSSNQLRITDLGLLIEDARTNIVLQSVDPSNLTNWTDYQCSFASATDPTGGSSNCQMKENVANDAHQLQQIISITSGTARAFSVSCYLKQQSVSRNVLIDHTDQSGNGVSFNIDTSTWGVVMSDLGTPFTNQSYTIYQMGGGWVRFTGTGTCLTTSTTLRFQMNLKSGGNTVYTGDGASGVYVFGPQIEEAAFASSYIPTTTTSATRALDSSQLISTALSLFNASPGTLILQTNLTAAGILSRLIGSGNEILYIDTDGTLHAISGGNNATVNASLRPSPDKSGYAWDTPNMSLVLNGGTVKTAADEISHSGATYLGTDSAGATPLYGYVTRLTMWNSKLADATLQSLTTP